MDKNHLQLDHLVVGYNGKALIRGIEIGVKRGEIVTLVGPNGSGKSTILKTITRQLVPVGGDIFLSELSEEKAGSTEEAAKKLEQFAPSALARNMAVMLTGRLQTELMTCRDVTAMGRYPYTGRLGILSKEDEQKVEAALAAVHAQHLSDRPFDAVSDGERQRILLARAICQEPKIIVLDEPTSYLDIRHKLELLSILHRMSRDQGITVVMSLHEIDLAMKISDRIICVRGEEIFACGKPSEILDDETVRRLYDLDPELGRFDARNGSLELFFAEKGFDAKDTPSKKHDTVPEDNCSCVPVDDKAFSKTGIPEENSSIHKKEVLSADAIAIPRLMIAAPGSGSGKTLITCGLLRLLQRKQLHPAAFKCGPDYIDPMFHRQVLGIPSRNLDTFFSPADPENAEKTASTGNTANIANAANTANVSNTTNTVKAALSRAVLKNRADIAVVEGVMGYFDGTGADGMEASSCDLARQTDTPVLLVLNAKGMSRSVVPQLKGFSDYEGKNRRIRGVILNRISAGMFPLMKKWIEEDTDLRVIGYLPQDDAISWGSRHLGLLQPEELTDLQGQIDHLADILEKTLDLDALLELAGTAPALPVCSALYAADRNAADRNAAERNAADRNAGPLEEKEAQYLPSIAAARDPGAPQKQAGEPGAGPRIAAARCTGAPPEQAGESGAGPRIAVARDEAFSFYYEDNLEMLQECGAELVFFSPVHDSKLPEADGLLLGGGYPELHARALAQNGEMKAQIRESIAAGMPVLAECGGFMYLQEKLIVSSQDADEGDSDHVPVSFEMCGVLPGTCRMTDRLVRFGYVELEKKEGTDKEAGFLKDGHRIRGHEFHYFDSTDNGDACTACKPGRRRSWDCMVVRGSLMAGFPHLYYRSDPEFAASFVEKCRQFRHVRLQDRPKEI